MGKIWKMREGRIAPLPFLDALDGKKKKKVRIREGKIPSLTGPLLQSIHKLIAEKEGIMAKYLV